jgi:hypothetical protein
MKQTWSLSAISRKRDRKMSRNMKRTQLHRAFLLKGSFSTLVITVAMSALLSLPSNASEEYTDTKVGEFIYIEGCIPFKAKSPVYLVSYTTKKQLLKITFDTRTLKGVSRPGYCNGDWNIYRKWKVSIKGTHELAIYVPNLKKYYEISPSGINSSATSKNPDDVVLDKPAANFFVPGTALVTLQQVWGISLNDANGPKNLRNVTDEIYLYLCRSVGRKVSQTDLEISFQPGNSMYSFFTRLIDNVAVYQVVKNRLIFNANQP